MEVDESKEGTQSAKCRSGCMLEDGMLLCHGYIIITIAVYTTSTHACLSTLDPYAYGEVELSAGDIGDKVRRRITDRAFFWPACASAACRYSRRATSKMIAAGTRACQSAYQRASSTRLHGTYHEVLRGVADDLRDGDGDRVDPLGDYVRRGGNRPHERSLHEQMQRAADVHARRSPTRMLLRRPPELAGHEDRDDHVEDEEGRHVRVVDWVICERAVLTDRIRCDTEPWGQHD
jgi:hypothetical protein